MIIKRLRAIVLGLTLLLTVGFAFAPSAGAVDVLSPVCNSVTNAGRTDVCGQDTAANKNNNPVVKALSVAITMLAIIIGVASTIVIIISGLRMVTSNGDAQKVASARSAITYALIGIAVAVLAGTIVGFVLNKL